MVVVFAIVVVIVGDKLSTFFSVSRVVVVVAADVSFIFMYFGTCVYKLNFEIRLKTQLPLRIAHPMRN